MGRCRGMGNYNPGDGEGKKVVRGKIIRVVVLTGVGSLVGRRIVGQGGYSHERAVGALAG
jgi:hypothetical protein